ncbi:MAG: hypothetical protein EXQ90_00445 [Rhodospirillales bacterium]|nr:hypothetical protein [Rhodospirillales bacterium]
MMRRLLVAAVISVSLISPSITNADVKTGEAAYNRGDYAATLREWQPLANAGDSVAQVAVGLLHERGQVDKVAAYMWFTLAARQNEPRAAEARDRIARSMSRAEIAQGELQAQMWRPTGQ